MIANKSAIWFCCVECGKWLARDAAADPDDRASPCDPRCCGACSQIDACDMIPRRQTETPHRSRPAQSTVTSVCS